MLTPHVVRVKTLYRKFLKNTFYWYGSDYNRFVNKSQELRMKFESYRHIKDASEIESLIKDAEEFLESTRHPDPYKAICSPGGGMFQRNAPTPRELLTPPPLAANDYDYSSEKFI